MLRARALAEAARAVPEPHRHGRRQTLAFISSHPVTAERMRAFDAADAPVTGAPLLDAEEWSALKTICGKAADEGRSIGETGR